MYKLSTKLIRISLFASLTSCLFVFSAFSACNKFDLVGSGIHLDQAKVHLVDIGEYNWLFRGNMPTTVDPLTQKVKFNYNLLIKYIRNAAATKGYNLPTNIYLVDVSLLNLAEIKDLNIEYNFFAGKNSFLGEVLNWSIFGGLVSPNAFNSKQRNLLLKSHIPLIFRDKVIQRVLSMKKMLDTKQSKTYVYYVHCEAGCDRTGEFFAAYRMKVLNEPLLTAWQKDTQECGRPPNKFAKDSVQWLCYALGRSSTECSQDLPVDQNITNRVYLPYS